MKNELKALIQYGNKKLPKTTAIFNMGSAQKCPSDKLGLCNVSKQCYAKKPEKMYPQVLPYRNRQAMYWLKNDKYNFVIDIMQAFKSKRIKPTHLRLNESGDFYSQECVNKAEYVAKHLYLNLGITTYCYTARKDLDFSNCEYLIINGSGFKKTGIKRAFTAVASLDKNALHCAGDCTICSLCASTSKKDIQVLMH